jgi:ADP-heptose:LPS heptosyltransferase
MGFNIVKEVKEKTSKKKVVVFQPFGRGVKADNNIIYDPSGRSFEGVHVIEIVKKLQKADIAVIVMSELGIDFQKHGCKDPVAMPQSVSLRQWAGIIGQADYFLGCDSVGQHLAVALNKPLSVVLGSTFPINVTYVDYDKLDILDMGGEVRQYSPIRITMDDVADRGNDGIMRMNEKIEDTIVESVINGMEKFPMLQPTTGEIAVTSAPSCPSC